MYLKAFYWNLNKYEVTPRGNNLVGNYPSHSCEAQEVNSTGWRTIHGLMVNGISSKVLSSKTRRWMLSWPRGTTSVSTHQQRHGPSPVPCHFSNPITFPFPCKTRGQKERKNTSAGRHQGCFNVNTADEACWYFTRSTKEMSFGTMAAECRIEEEGLTMTDHQ